MNKNGKVVIFACAFLVVFLGLAMLASILTRTTVAKADAPARVAASGNDYVTSNDLAAAATSAPIVGYTPEQSDWLTKLSLSAGQYAQVIGVDDQHFVVQFCNDGKSYAFFSTVYGYQRLLTPVSTTVDGVTTIVYVEEGYFADEEISASDFFAAMTFKDRLIPPAVFQDGVIIDRGVGVPTPTPAP